MTTPYVGGPSDDHRALCSYSPRPGVSCCPGRATVHLLVDAPRYGPVGLESCDDHATIGRASAPVLGEHQHQGLCGLPATRWAGDRCVLDDSGVEPERPGPVDDRPRCTSPGVCYCTARPGCPDLDEDGQPWDDSDTGWDDDAPTTQEA